MASATRGDQAQFTYDFGIAISQSTLGKVTRLTGATLTLASAFYALKSTAAEYVDTLRANTLRFGGILSTLKAMEQAQNRLIKGQSYFTMDDQLQGMNKLMAAGVDVKKNLEWVNKAAHATGKSFDEFSNAIYQGISGNMGALVDMGLLTQRAVRMFEKYPANTIMRQQAILNFMRQHKGLQAAIKNDFETVQDQMKRLKATWQSFLQSVVGKPNDPSSFYGQIVSATKMVAEAIARNMEEIKKRGWVIGQVLGWVMRQIGHFVVWVGRQVKKAINSVWKITDNFQEQTRSLLVWLEFWKLKVVDFFKEYGGAIKSVLKLLILFKAMKLALVISEAAILSVIRFRKEWVKLMLFMDMGRMGKLKGLSKLLTFNLVKRSNNRQILRFFGIDPRKVSGAFSGVAEKTSSVFSKVFSKKALLALLNPMTYLRGIGKVFRGLFGGLGKFGKLAVGIFKNFRVLLPAIFKGVRVLWTALRATNPVGWILIAVELLVLLYRKCEAFRNFVNGLFRFIKEGLGLIWNYIMYGYVQIRIGLRKIGEWFTESVWEPTKTFFTDCGSWISNMWGRFMDTRVGKWLQDAIISPVQNFFTKITNLWDRFVNKVKNAFSWLVGKNKEISAEVESLAASNNISVATYGGYNSNTGTVPITTAPVGPLLPEYMNPQSDTKSSNPITDYSYPDSSPYSSFDDLGGGGTSMSFNKGAIQITVQKGENIDEQKLAQKIREVIEDMERTNKKRSGA